MAFCPECKNDVTTFISEPETLETCSICGTIISQSNISTVNYKQNLPANTSHIQTENDRTKVLFLLSCCHLFGLSGYIDEATVILKKVSLKPSFRMSTSLYGAVVCIIARKYRKSIAFSHVANFLQCSTSKLVTTFKNVSTELGIKYPKLDPEIHFYQYYDTLVSMHVCADNSRQFYLQRFLYLHHVCETAFYFEGRNPQIAYFAIAIASIAPQIVLISSKLHQLSKKFGFGRNTVHIRLKELAKIVENYLQTKSLETCSFGTNLEIFFKYYALLQLKSIHLLPESFVHNRHISEARKEAALKINTLLLNLTEENVSFLEFIFQDSPSLRNMLMLALLGVPTKVLVELPASRLSELVELSQTEISYEDFE